MNVRIEQGWKNALASEWQSEGFQRLTDFVRNEYATATVFPPASQIFAAFDACPYADTRVVILGQDPYHDVGQANGLCFSVAPGTPLPPSLINILREVAEDTCQPGRRPVAMGPTGRIAAKLDPDGARPSCRLASGQRLGGIHRQRHPAFGQPSPWAGIHALGQLCHQKRRIHRPATPSGADIAPPFAIVRISRIFRQPPFHTCQRLSRSART